ncbi:hypothetical protein BDZ94DRAFT_605393 [Collybia nuda]|uniref:N-acetyltransferase domain-containing protein n=1 Tax=Collybia nuda TaxID=64659 RepID=A0A9P5Y7B3_9AGAR|nr:hypothetical protein BDZ94DRAFT_605393 [Collybia nuda]
MPVPLSGLTTLAFTRATDISNDVWSALDSYANDANVILPQANKALIAESSGQPSGYHLWIACSWNGIVEFVLSCTPGDMGEYPIFICATMPFNYLTDAYIRPRIGLVAARLRAEIPSVGRVYSVYAPEPVTKLFAEEWTRLTGIRHYSEPYYAANITFCTTRSFVNRQTSVHPSLTYDLRLAEENDIPAIAPLCYGFAKESPPFDLTEYESHQEATNLVRNKQVWVHTVRKPGQSQVEIASIVATTRNTDKVGTISKVYTNPTWRRHGCAERLVRRVCKHLLNTKNSVVLYVAHSNHGAAKVYHRVGFQGLSADDDPVEGVYPWLELGFDQNEVELGHW